MEENAPRVRICKPFREPRNRFRIRIWAQIIKDANNDCSRVNLLLAYNLKVMTATPPPPLNPSTLKWLNYALSRVYWVPRPSTHCQGIDHWWIEIGAHHSISIGGLVLERRGEVHKYPSYTVAKFIVLDQGDKINPGIGLSYRPARLHRLGGQYDNPMPESTTYIPQAKTMNLATGYRWKLQELCVLLTIKIDGCSKTQCN